MRIKELRQSKGLTRSDLEKKLNAASGWACALEEDPQMDFTEQQLRSISEALNCTVGELFDDPIELELEALINPDRFDKIQEVLEKSAKLGEHSNQSADVVKALLKGFEQSLTAAEITMLALAFTKKEPSESDLKQVVSYLKVLKTLNVPLTTLIKDFTPEQLRLQENSEEFLQSLNKFRGDWAKANANAAAIRSQPSDTQGTA